MSEVIGSSYQSLKENVTLCISPKLIFHQIDHLLRLVLSPQEQTGWLKEPYIDAASDEIKPVVEALFEKCSEAYSDVEISLMEMDEALKQMDDILKFYFAEDMDGKNS